MGEWVIKKSGGVVAGSPIRPFSRSSSVLPIHPSVPPGSFTALSSPPSTGQKLLLS